MTAQERNVLIRGRDGLTSHLTSPASVGATHPVGWSL
jgi:hypothetical protein